MSEGLILDLSNNNGLDVDFARARDAGVKGVWLKVSEGRTFVDSRFQRFRAAARAAGLHVGGYHYARPDFNTPEREAQHFHATLGPIGANDLRPVLDFEVWANRLSAGEHVAWARAFNREFLKLSGHRPIFYSYSSFIDRMGPWYPIGSALWLANYGANDGERHPARPPRPWRRWSAHQFTSNGRIPGVPYRVDVSYAPNWPGLVVGERAAEGAD